ncbi:hypothetical protein NHX12_001707 [Muraenolepis orangiensis]|uniref:Uncharacterized protein n=1 Tax=Muraenolepis orangiensis TaxID=630683 RepID=A0A9Q0IIF1_9TELE|nr:hypothetical protein NHX12_001707 [Muraenolepis orangiensis]
MSVSMTKSGGVTVMTMNSDTGSTCPPLCQILKALCYSPVCCSVSQKLRSIMGTSHSALGTLEVMVGLMNLGLGAILSGNWSFNSWMMYHTGFPYWLGTLFILFGILCILSEKFPSPCLVVSSVSAHLAGVAFSITAVVLYSINLSSMSFWRTCNQYYNYYNRWDTTTTPPPGREVDLQKCLEGKRIISMVVGGVNVVLIILSVLQLCVSISCVVLGIRAVRKSFKKENQILQALCYSPVCCSVSQKLRSIMGTSHSALGTLEVMVGLMNLGLGAILSGNWSFNSWLIYHTGFPYWLGTLFILFGILCILSEKFPSPCLVSLKLHTSPMVVGGVNVVLIILSVLQLCVSISCVVLGIRAVRKSFKKENQVQLGGGVGGRGGEPVAVKRRRTRYS